MHSYSRQLLTAVVFSFFGVTTLCNAASASPPTHYVADPPNTWYLFMGDTPVAAAQAAISWWNSLESIRKWENLGMCSVSISPGDVHYSCPFDQCDYYPSGTICGQNNIVVWPVCGNVGAAWNGTEFYCPPEPDCDGPAQ